MEKAVRPAIVARDEAVALVVQEEDYLAVHGAVVSHVENSRLPLFFIPRFIVFGFFFLFVTTATIPSAA
jgi:hypothetical protein